LPSSGRVSRTCRNETEVSERRDSATFRNETLRRHMILGCVSIEVPLRSRLCLNEGGWCQSLNGIVKDSDKIKLEVYPMRCRGLFEAIWPAKSQ